MEENTDMVDISTEEQKAIQEAIDHFRDMRKTQEEDYTLYKVHAESIKSKFPDYVTEFVVDAVKNPEKVIDITKRLK